MSTRCQILVHGHDTIIYRHSDGYPEGVLPDILPTIKRFISLRGFENDYLTARILGALLTENNKLYSRMIARRKRQKEDYKDLEASRDTLGFGVEAYGVGAGLHGDIEFLYIVYADRVEIRKPKPEFWNSDSPNLSMFEIHSEVDFDGKPYAGEAPVKGKRQKIKV